MQATYQEIINFISRPRLAPYLRACQNNEEQALYLYAINMRLSAAFLPLLSLLEICLRNAVVQSAEKKLGAGKFLTLFDNHSFLKGLRDYILSAKKGAEKELKDAVEKEIILRWRTERPSFKKTNPEYQNVLDKTVEKQLKRSKQLRGNYVVASTKFAFWTSLFDKEYYAEAASAGLIPIKAKRLETYSMLYNIRQSRNRIAHHEPIIFTKQELSIERVRTLDKDIRSILELLHESIPSYFEQIYELKANLAKIEDCCSEIQKFVSDTQAGQATE